jgi:hypothetical protein
MYDYASTVETKKLEYQIAKNTNTLQIFYKKWEKI